MTSEPQDVNRAKHALGSGLGKAEGFELEAVLSPNSNQVD